MLPSVLGLAALLLSTELAVPTQGLSQIYHCQKPGVVALTYDDGPSENTEELLDQAKKLNIPLTFFWLGKNLQQYSDAVKRAFREGHQLASHSYNHEQLPTLSYNQILQEEVQQTNAEFKKILGIAPTYFRCPYGNCNTPHELQPLADGGVKVINWNMDTHDWQPGKSAATTMEAYKGFLAAQPQLPEGLIALMHETYQPSIDILGDVTNFLKSRGATFATVAECLGDGSWFTGTPDKNAIFPTTAAPTTTPPPLTTAAPTTVPVTTVTPTTSGEQQDQPSVRTTAPSVVGGKIGTAEASSGTSFISLTSTFTLLSVSFSAYYLALA